ncbi:MAG: deiodinase-like protein [Phycisphaerales bacterium]
MRKARLISVLLYASLFIAVPTKSFAQDGSDPATDDAPERVAPVEVRRLDRRPGAGRQQDQQRNEVLSTIRAAVSPTDEQMATIVALFEEYRREQREAMREFMMNRTDRRRPGADEGADGDRPRRRGLGGGLGAGGEFEMTDEQRAARDAMMKELEAALAPVNENFLAECRAIMRDDQLEDWDACAASIDLNPRRGRNDARNWLDPARGPAVGDTAPVFTLTNLEGDEVSLADFRGKPVVLEFGSYTCPIFRRKVDAIDALRDRYGTNVNWILVYTMEAHPTDGWAVETNRRQGIEIAQHTSYESRVESARLCAEKLDLDLTLLVDSFDDAVTTAYSGHPNRGYIIDADGVIVSKQVWIEADQTKRVLDELLGLTKDGI